MAAVDRFGLRIQDGHQSVEATRSSDPRLRAEDAAESSRRGIASAIEPFTPTDERLPAFHVDRREPVLTAAVDVERRKPFIRRRERLDRRSDAAARALGRILRA